MKKPLFLIFIVLIIDQLSKIYIKTHFVHYESIHVLGWDWFQIYFVQNNGMAWGTEIGGKTGKFLLTTFRLVASVGIFYWLYQSVKQHKHQLLIFSIALILAGAIGNIIDSLFYGMIFNDPVGVPATLFAENPYSTFYFGKVVDMFYFPIIKNQMIPEWMPLVGGENFTFFNAIFNVADSSITIGVAILLLFNNRIFHTKKTIETDA